MNKLFVHFLDTYCGTKWRYSLSICELIPKVFIGIILVLGTVAVGFMLLLIFILPILAITASIVNDVSIFALLKDDGQLIAFAITLLAFILAGIIGFIIFFIKDIKIPPLIKQAHAAYRDKYCFKIDLEKLRNES